MSAESAESGTLIPSPSPVTGAAAVEPTKLGASLLSATKAAATGAVATASRERSPLPDLASTAGGRHENGGEAVAASNSDDASAAVRGGSHSAGDGVEPHLPAAASRTMQMSFKDDTSVREELDSARLRVSSLVEEIERERLQHKDGSFERSATSQLPSLRSAMGGRRRAIRERRTLKARRSARDDPARSCCPGCPLLRAFQTALSPPPPLPTRCPHASGHGAHTCARARVARRTATGTRRQNIFPSLGG